MRINITRDTMTPDIARLIRSVKRPKALTQAGAKAVQSGISKHLQMLQARGNVKGWPDQKFFAGKATSVEKNVGVPLLTDHLAVISIADPRFVHRIQGGAVTPKRRKFLAIPLIAEAYALSGKGSIKNSAPELKVIFTKKGAWLVKELWERKMKSGQRAGQWTRVGDLSKLPKNSTARQRYEFWFKLVRSVTHKPHPEEAPDQGVLATLARDAMQKAAYLLFGLR